MYALTIAAMLSVSAVAPNQFPGTSPYGGGCFGGGPQFQLQLGASGFQPQFYQQPQQFGGYGYPFGQGQYGNPTPFQSGIPIGFGGGIPTSPYIQQGYTGIPWQGGQWSGIGNGFAGRGGGY